MAILDRPQPDYGRAIADYDQAGRIDANDSTSQNGADAARQFAKSVSVQARTIL
jgi:hypothetical protein